MKKEKIMVTMLINGLSNMCLLANYMRYNELFFFSKCFLLI